MKNLDLKELISLSQSPQKEENHTLTQSVDFYSLIVVLFTRVNRITSNLISSRHGSAPIFVYPTCNIVFFYATSLIPQMCQWLYSICLNIIFKKIQVFLDLKLTFCYVYALIYDWSKQTIKNEEFHSNNHFETTEINIFCGTLCLFSLIHELSSYIRLTRAV